MNEQQKVIHEALRILGGSITRKPELLYGTPPYAMIVEQLHGLIRYANCLIPYPRDMDEIFKAALNLRGEEYLGDI